VIGADVLVCRGGTGAPTGVPKEKAAHREAHGRKACREPQRRRDRLVEQRVHDVLESHDAETRDHPHERREDQYFARTAGQTSKSLDVLGFGVAHNTTLPASHCLMTMVGMMQTSMAQRSRADRFADEVEATLRASRALVGVAARSLAILPDDLTLPQFRALVFIAQHESTVSGALAVALGVHPSSVTRLVDRLVAKDLVERHSSSLDRREVHVALTDAGRSVVERVTRARRRDLAAILRRVPVARRAELVRALDGFARAAGEADTEAWSLGWTTA
jgi:DNA-binding MarR family transcriptional regulator